ncbi:MAG: helix-turn-helix transcriptional regulator [Rhodospirillales bacterium]
MERIDTTPASTSYLTQHEAAAYLRLSPRTLERHRVAGTGPAFVKAGRRILYRRDEIDAWAAQRTFTSTAEVEAAGSWTAS